MNPATAQARVVVDELVRCGVRQVVVCPGSRNAPLSMALFEAASRGELTLHVRIDERSAGFFALGLGKSGHLAAVVCTSGTAVANLHPAVLEARHGAVPLLLLTADRPVELVPTGANQVITQSGIYGPAAVSLDFPIAEQRAGQNAVWRSLICRAVSQATAGPVQVNLPLREPLVPDGDPAWPESLDGRPDGRPWTTWTAAAEASAPTSPELGPRPLLVLGDGDPELLLDTARKAALAGWPVLAEPTAAPSALSGGAALIESGSVLMSAGELPPALRPTGLVVAGRPTLTRWVAKLMRSIPAVHVVDKSPQWADASFAATSTSPRLAPPADRSDPSWLAAWQRADDLVAGAVDKLLTDQPWPAGLPVARELMAALPTGATLFLGSSNPIRLVDLVAHPRADLRVYANRGVAGIDGSVSTALGLALGTDIPAYALLGDLTFLHDTNGLLLGPDEQRPDLTIVVLNDSGGGIFSLLEQGGPEHAASFERVFGTPHKVDLAALTKAHHVPHELIHTSAQLRTALAPRPGLRVIEIPVPRKAIRDDHTALRAAAAEALRG